MRVLRAVPLAAILLLSLAVTGCWDRREVNDILIVSATALDREEEKYRVTVQAPLPGQMGGAGSGGGGGGTSGQKPWFNHSETGRSVREANETQQRSLSRMLNFSHRRVLLIGEGLARSGISQALDILGRIPQNRMTAYMLMVQGNAEEALNIDASTEKMPAEMLRELASIPFKKPRTIDDTVHAILSEGTDPYLPYIRLGPSPSGAKQPAPTVEGVALFSGEKLATFVNGTISQGLLLALDQASNPVVTIKAPEGNGFISIRLPNYNVRVRAETGGEAPTFTVSVEGRMILAENSSDFHAAKNSDTILDMERAVNRHLEQVMQGGLEAARDAGSDPMGFGDYLYQHKPSYWKRIKPNWKQTYSAIRIVAKSRVTFQHPGTFTYPLGVPDHQLVP